ncbi:NUDIX hydrolase [Paracoccus aestuarii]|uniref:NUDIX hydrolase n=1 Tax=Paracoccus aestuarii TaxID=453842 RepID=A0A418ZTM8_9RHOB|nr:NUDIX domain-containing protein [Paracoccus aestuarii]RJL00718.1 NUDIX hydrolase [Paracoccus aestuarii]WCQ98267.1 NUDIX hydrolase [Paracoccus aestuarii]
MIRLAVRAAILHADRVLVVNAYPGHGSDLWCLPGGGVDPHASLPDNLAREVAEETGLTIRVGRPFLVNEFHDPDRRFHQVEIHFHAGLTGSDRLTLTDPEGIVNRARGVTRAELASLRHKPDSLVRAIWSPDAALYDDLERIVP